MKSLLFSICFRLFAAENTVGYTRAFNTTISGFDLYFYRKASDITDCVERCNWDERCTAVTFMDADQRCYLKTGDGVTWEDELTLQTGATSAFVGMQNSKPPTVPNKCERSEFRVFADKTIEDSQLGAFFTFTLKDCQIVCSRMYRCSGYSFKTQDDNTTICNHKMGNITENSLSFSEGAFSGIPCPEVEFSNYECQEGDFTFVPGAEIIGRDLYPVLSFSADSCRSVCINVRACTGYTFMAKETNCILKQGEETFKYAISLRDDVVSGNWCPIRGIAVN